MSGSNLIAGDVDFPYSSKKQNMKADESVQKTVFLIVL